MHSALLERGGWALGQINTAPLKPKSNRIFDPRNQVSLVRTDLHSFIYRNDI